MMQYRKWKRDNDHATLLNILVKIIRRQIYLNERSNTIFMKLPAEYRSIQDNDVNQ